VRLFRLVLSVLTRFTVFFVKISSQMMQSMVKYWVLELLWQESEVRAGSHCARGADGFSHPAHLRNDLTPLLLPPTAHPPLTLAASRPGRRRACGTQLWHHIHPFTAAMGRGTTTSIDTKWPPCPAASLTSFSLHAHLSYYLCYNACREGPDSRKLDCTGRSKRI